MPMIGTSNTLPLVNATRRAGEQANRALIPLATGSRINRAADDPAGLISSEQIRAQLRAIESEQRSLDRADAVARTADASLFEVSALTTDARALAVAAANTGGMSAAERDALQFQYDEVVESIDRTISSASFNGQAIFSGDVALRAGGDEFNIDGLTPANLGATTVDGVSMNLRDTLGDGLSENPSAAQDVLGALSDQISTIRGGLGSFQRNAIDSTRGTLSARYENLSEAFSLIRDTDYTAQSSRAASAGATEQAALGALARAERNMGQTIDLIFG